MQGKKIYQEKLFNSFSLSSRVPENNFYRRLKGACNFDFLYKLTEDFYGSSGQKSIGLWDTHPIYGTSEDQYHSKCYETKHCNVVVPVKFGQ